MEVKEKVRGTQQLFEVQKFTKSAITNINDFEAFTARKRKRAKKRVTLTPHKRNSLVRIKYLIDNP